PLTHLRIDLLRHDMHPSNSKGCGIKPGALHTALLLERAQTLHRWPEGRTPTAGERSRRVPAVARNSVVSVAVQRTIDDHYGCQSWRSPVHAAAPTIARFS